MDSQGYQYTATVLHRGIVFAFTASDDPTSDDIFYNVLNLGVESPDDALDWSGFRKLEFPKQLRTLGMGMLTVPMSDETTGGTAHGQFKALSDQQYVYIFRRSNKGTLYCNRFSLVEEPGERESDDAVRSLEPAWEVRFLRSGKRDIPQSDRDYPAYSDATGAHFIEPTLELSMVEGLDDSGGFCVLLVPAQVDDRPRWQVFAHDTKAGCISMFSFARDETGLFDVAGKQVDPARKTILPDRQFTLSMRDGTDPVALDVVTGLAGVVYYKQERATGADGKDVGLKRSGRVLLVAGVLPEGGTLAQRCTATIDFAISRDGTLAEIEPDTLLGKIDPASHTLYFDDASRIDLANSANVLSLAGSFTLEVWVQAEALDSQVRAILGGESLTAGDCAPYLSVVDGVVHTGFAGASMATPNAVLQRATWNHVAVAYDDASGAITLYVNGAVQAASKWTGKKPSGKPITLVGAPAGTPGQPAACLSFMGSMDELRIWKVVRTQAEIIQYLYSELPEPADLPDLVGYWAFDRTTHQGEAITVPDLSRYGNTGTLHGPQVQAATSPVEAASSAELQIDADGLTVEAGYLPFAAPASTPYALDGADGLVHLYYQGSDDLFTVAQYDAAIARAIYYLPWSTNPPCPADGQVQALALVSHRAGTLMNGCKVSVAPVQAAPQRTDLCTLVLHTRTDAEETWQGLPRNLDRFTQVLQGRAIGDPSDPRLKNGDRRFYDYAGNHDASWLSAGGGDLLVVTRRPSIANDGTPDPNGLDLAYVDVKDGATGTCTMTVAFKVDGSDDPIVQVWPGVPTGITELVATLNGLSNQYAYESPGPGTPPIYSFMAGSSRLLLLARTTNVTQARLRVLPGSDARKCKMAVDLTAGGESLAFETREVERDQKSVAKALRECTTKDGEKLVDYVFVSSDGLATDVPDQERVYAGTTDGLRAAACLFSVVVDGASGAIAAQNVPSARLQKAQSSDGNVDLALGSALFGAAAVCVPTNGQTASVRDTAEADLWQPGVDGGWLAEPPRFAVAFDRNAASIALGNDKAVPLHIRGDLSIEAWVDPAGASSSPNPRIISYNKKGDLADADDFASYMLGCTESKFLQITASNTLGTAIELASAQGIFGKEAYTIQLWMRPDLSTVGDVAQTVWKRASDEGFDHLVVDKAGVLTLTTQDNTGVVSVSSTIALATLQWSHVSVVRGDGGIAIFVGGVEFGRKANASALRPATWFVVGGNAGQGNLIQCGINELRVWSRALGGREIAANMSVQLPADAQDLQLRWSLSSDADGDVVRNTAQTGAIYDGKLVNGRAWKQPGVFYTAYAGSRRKAVRTSAAVVPRDNWTHLAAVYDTANALQFDQAAYGDCGNDAAFDFDQAFGIDLWITPGTAGATGNEALVSKWGDLPRGQSWELGIGAGGFPYLKLRMEDGDKVLDVITSRDLALTPGAPHHVAATLAVTVITKVVTAAGASTNLPVVAGSEPVEETVETSQDISATVYVDGKVAGSFSTTIKDGQYAITRSSTAVQLARTRPDATGPAALFLQAPYSGAMSNVRVWTRALSAADVAVLAAPESEVSPDGLAAWWPFSEMTGTVAFDQAGTNNARLTRNDMWRLYDANATLRLYVNGDPTPTIAIAPSVPGGYGEQQLRLGGMRGDGLFAQGWTGTIDEIRVWDTNLTREQISDSMDRPLAGNEKGLAGYWRFDAGSGRSIADQTGRGNDAVMEKSGAGLYPAWVVSTAPVNNEGPAVYNALGGLITPATATISGPPAAVDYPDMQRDVAGELFSVIKRLYAYPDGGDIVLQTGFKLGDLDTVYVGQIQTNPKLIGYIEGAPPLPSENQSRPLYANPHLDQYLHYMTASKVTIKQEDETVRAYSSTKKTGFDLSTEIKAGIFMKNEVDGGGPFLHVKTLDLEGHIGVHASLDYSTSVEDEQEAKGNRTSTFSNAIDCGGEWEEKGPPSPGNPNGWLNPLVGRRFIPENNGYALVKSLTADMFAQTLKTTGALVALTVVPNQEIPEDINILTFPIRPRYTKNGTLDGKVGLVNDASYPDANLLRGSYFKPVQAYALKRRIDRQSKQLAAYWDQFDAQGRGQSGKAGLDGVRDDDPYYDWKIGVARKGIVNNYAWTAGGGLYTDEEEYGSTYAESHSGSYEFKGMAGLMGDGEGAFFGMGFYADVDFLMGGHVEVAVLKQKEDSRSFGVEVELETDRFLKRYLGDDNPDEPYSRTACPGKVDGYRFMTFYLPPNEANAGAFKDEVVDDTWLEHSDEPAAVALRELSYDENGVWRIFHRVTYVSRVPPEFQPVPDETQPPPVMEPANVEGNLELIQLVQLALGKDEPTPLNIGRAVNEVLDSTLATTLPWWNQYLRAAQAFQSDAQKTLQALRVDLLGYMNEAYATVLAEDEDNTR